MVETGSEIACFCEVVLVDCFFRVVGIGNMCGSMLSSPAPAEILKNMAAVPPQLL